MPENYNVQTTGHEAVRPLFEPVVNRYLIEVAKPNLVFAQFGQRVKVPKGKGKTIYFDKYVPLPLAKTPLTEGVVPKGADLDVKRVSGEPTQHGNYVATSDEFDFYKHDPSPEVLRLTELLGENAAETLNSLTCDIIASGTNVQYAGGKTSRAALTSEDKITLADIKKAVRTLKKNKARKFKGKDFVCVIDPETSHDLTNDPLWKDVKIRDPKDLYEGEIGKIFGVIFVETTETESDLLKEANAAREGEGKPAVHFAYVMGADAYGVTDPKDNVETITHDKHSIGGPLDQYSTMGWKGHHFAKILVPEWLVRIECAVSE